MAGTNLPPVRAGRTFTLRSAQRVYIATAPTANATHPYYWSGLSLEGSTAAFTNSGANYWWWVVLSISALLFVSIRQKKKSSP